MTNVYLAEFDQCQFGLVSKETRTPVKKRTRVLTNCQTIFNSLHKKDCPGDHAHQIISGSEGGCKRSVAAQEYPQPMIDAICKAILKI